MKTLKPLLILPFSLIIFLGLSSISSTALLAQAAGGVLYVKPAGSGDCSSWALACDLQTALTNAVRGDQVWAASGTYTPTTGTDRSATFTLISGVEIYGGFAGTETSLAERNWQANPTTLSGEIGSLTDSTDNCYHVVTGGADATTVLDGFTISGGYANSNYPNDNGGGIYNANGSPILNNLILSANTAVRGGGIFNQNSYSTQTNLTFINNSALQSGGGMYNAQGSPTLNKLIFSGNTAAYHGGGMVNNASHPTLTDITFASNTAYEGNGGGMYNEGSNPNLSGVTFSANSAGYYGGGMYNTTGAPTLSNVTFSGNSVTNTQYSDGGGMYNWSSGPTLTNVTFYGNTSAFGDGGGIRNINSTPTLVNAILWGNTPAQISETLTSNISYSAIQGDTVYPGTGNINADPLLEPLADNGSFSQTHALGVGSPAIDAGSPSNYLPADQRGYPRPMDGNKDGTAVADMGAYEFGPVIIINIVGSGSVSLLPEKPEYRLGDVVSLTPNPAAGWRFANWSWDAAGTDNPLFITIDGSKNITATFATTRYAKEGGTGLCTSWADACELRSALAIASEFDEIWVAAGTHKPTAGTDRQATFALKPGVAIYGGFPDTGDPAWEQRDWETNPTTLSGDIGTIGDSADNSYHVLTGDGPGTPAVLDGFTISGGNADGPSPYDMGAGMYNLNSGPTLTNLTFSGNAATWGGAGIFNAYDSSPNLSNVTFSGNSAGTKAVGCITCTAARP